MWHLALQRVTVPEAAGAAVMKVCTLLYLCRCYDCRRDLPEMSETLPIKAGLYRIWCGVNRLGDCGVHTLGDTSPLVNPAGQLLVIRRGKT